MVVAQDGGYEPQAGHRRLGRCCEIVGQRAVQELSSPTDERAVGKEWAMERGATKLGRAFIVLAAGEKRPARCRWSRIRSGFWPTESVSK